MEGVALKQLAPGTGDYMKEVNRLVPDFMFDFYEEHYKRVEGIERMYDPDDTFCCPIYVGNDWRGRMDYAGLCRA